MTITNEQRRIVRERAEYCCEYCRVAESDRLSTFHIDHIIALKHDGTDDTDNLCFACYKCNGYKGSNVAGLDPETNEASKLYHPRQQQWDDHFQINNDGTLAGKTPEGRVTINILRINSPERVKPRHIALQIGEYPCGLNDIER